jgi:hypothetical protein
MQDVKSWYQQFPGRWVLYWLLMPNATIILMWLVGGPPMTRELAIFAVLALAVAQASSLVAKRLMLAIMIVELNYYYVCTMFNLSPGNWAMLPGFLREVQPFRSPEYLLAALLFLGFSVCALIKAPRVPRFGQPLSYLFGSAAIIALVVADYQATAATRGSYRAEPLPGDPYTSVAAEVGVTRPDEQSPNLVLVMVEALGVPLDPTGRSLFDATWHSSRWLARYDVSRGSVPFYGATTNGELRELCNQWGHYSDFDFAAVECLPERYARAGYQTVAYHGFAKLMFDRDHWFPQMGFQRLSFGEDLLEQGLPVCPGVFPGACDEAIADTISERLKGANKRQFIYWITLNSHLPVLKSRTLGTERCQLGSGDWAAENPQVCRLFLVHQHLADAITDLAMDPDLPPTDFIIVGDHAPPFFDRNSRQMFDNANVPWLYLRFRVGAERATTRGTSLALTGRR